MGSGALDLGVFASQRGPFAYGELSTKISPSWAAAAGGQLGLEEWLVYGGFRAEWQGMW